MPEVTTIIEIFGYFSWMHDIAFKQPLSSDISIPASSDNSNTLGVIISAIGKIVSR